MLGSTEFSKPPSSISPITIYRFSTSRNTRGCATMTTNIRRSGVRRSPQATPMFSSRQSTITGRRRPLSTRSRIWRENGPTSPVRAFVTYGGVFGGQRALQIERLAVTHLKMMPIPESVSIPMFTSLIDSDKVFKPNELITMGADVLLDELAKWAGTLKQMHA